MDLQVAFLLFESQREHLKFQLEHYLMKLMEIVNSESNRILYEQRELALGAYNFSQRSTVSRTHRGNVNFIFLIHRGYSEVVEDTWLAR